MKPLFIFTFLIILQTTVGHAQTTARIKLLAGDCRYTRSPAPNEIDTIFFYKLPENTLALKITQRQYYSFPILLDNIPVSEYKLQYKNIYHQQVTKHVNITSQDTNTIVLCPDALQSYSLNTLSKLMDRDTIAINFSSFSCFSGYSSRLVITRETGHFTATIFDAWHSRLEKNNAINKDTLTVTLTNRNIEDFTRFENELHYAGGLGCRTMDWYYIQSKYLQLRKRECSCGWNGFSYLRRSFFGDKK